MSQPTPPKSLAPGEAVLSEQPFHGFESLDANFIYCPNQFFDVCLRHASRGVLRLVAFLLDQTLGWLDSNGNPITEEIPVSYKRLITEAGISRGAIRKTIDEAIAAGFIRCLHAGRAYSSGQSAEQASFTLRWDAAGVYSKDLNGFQGFFAGTGHCTPIPDRFFRVVVPQESLAVVKVVGTVLRHTVGFESKYGGRRRQATLSYNFIQHYSGLCGRHHISAAIQHAIASNYITRIQKGKFSSDANQRTAATYGIRWVSDANRGTSGSKKLPVLQPKEVTGETVQKSNQEQSKNVPSIGSETLPAKRFKKVPLEKTVKKNRLKQQGQMPPAVATLDSEAYRLLTDIGFDQETACKLVEGRGLTEIKQQIAWLDERNPRDNKLGMLRKAIEQNWAKPMTVEQAEKRLRRAEQARALAKQEEIEDAQIAERKQKRNRQRDIALVLYEKLPDDERTSLESVVFERLGSDFFRKRFRINEQFRLQQCLDEICRREGSSTPTLSV